MEDQTNARVPLSDELRRRIQSRSGSSQKSIARAAGINYVTLRSWLQNNTFDEGGLNRLLHLLDLNVDVKNLRESYSFGLTEWPGNNGRPREGFGIRWIQDVSNMVVSDGMDIDYQLDQIISDTQEGDLVVYLNGGRTSRIVESRDLAGKMINKMNEGVGFVQVMPTQRVREELYRFTRIPLRSAQYDVCDFSELASASGNSQLNALILADSAALVQTGEHFYIREAEVRKEAVVLGRSNLYSKEDNSQGTERFYLLNGKESRRFQGIVASLAQGARHLDNSPENVFHVSQDSTGESFKNLRSELYRRMSQ